MANWTVTGAESRDVLQAGGRFVKGYDVHFVVHETDTQDTVFVPERDFLDRRAAEYIQPRADAIAATVGMTNRSQ